MDPRTEPLSVDEAISGVLRAIEPGPTDRIAVAEARGRVLRAPVCARQDHPPHDRSEMDGYAARWADVSRASPEAAVALDIVAELPAGAVPFAGVLRGGEAARVLTGGPVPAGADVVIPQEWTDGGAPRVSITRAPSGPGVFIRRRAADVAAGAVVVPEGVRLLPGRVSQVAASGAAALEVGRRPRVATIATGDELLPPGAPARAGAFWESNRLLVRGLLEEEGAEVSDLGICSDEPGALEALLERALPVADVVVTTGGVGPGPRDRVRPLLTARASRILVGRVRLKPGKPTMAGLVQRPGGGSPVLWFGLPGNPSAVLAGLVLFAVPAVRRLQGLRHPGPMRISARLATSAEALAERESYLRGSLSVRTGELWALPGARQASGSVRAVAEASVLIRVPAGAGRLERGSAVEVIPIGRVLERAAGAAAGGEG